MKRFLVETFAQLLTLIVILAVLALLSGCIGFSGKRKAAVSVNILGNTITWESTCDGAYEPPEEGASCTIEEPAVPSVPVGE